LVITFFDHSFYGRSANVQSRDILKFNVQGFLNVM
jgi:hypothetical protein